MQYAIDRKIPETLSHAREQEGFFATRVGVGETEAALAALVFSILEKKTQTHLRTVVGNRLLQGEERFEENVRALEEKYPNEAALLGVLRVLLLTFPPGYALSTTEEQGPAMTLLLLSVLERLLSPRA